MKPDDRLANLERQYAQTRQQLKGTKRDMGRQSDEAFKRFAAQQGLQGSGALLKAQGLQQQQLGQQFGELEAGVSAQEAQAREGILGEREIRQSEQAFASKEAALGREHERGMFDANLKFQKDSWADQFGLALREFDENLKTNIINAAIALNESKLTDASRWYNLLSGDPDKPGMLPMIYGDRVPRIDKTSTRYLPHYGQLSTYGVR